MLIIYFNYETLVFRLLRHFLIETKCIIEGKDRTHVVIEVLERWIFSCSTVPYVVSVSNLECDIHRKIPRLSI